MALGAGLISTTLAGCSGESETIDDPENTDTPGDGNGGPEPTTPTVPPGEPDIRFGDRQLHRESGQFRDTVFAEIIVENIGDGASGQVSVDIDWFDPEDNFLGNDTAYLPSLDGGETWIAQQSPFSADSEEVDDFEISGDFQTGPPLPPDGMSVAESELVVEDFNTQIEGLAENNRTESLDYVEAIGKIYDDGGNVIGGTWTNESDVPAGRNWRFEIVLSGRAATRASEAADHTVLLDGDFF